MFATPLLPNAIGFVRFCAGIVLPALPALFRVLQRKINLSRGHRPVCSASGANIVIAIEEWSTAAPARSSDERSLKQMARVAVSQAILANLAAPGFMNLKRNL
jgi:hypothetical protein